ncbi:MAG: AAA family ATPase [Gammaproteobacteria bacterium]|jgi:hypothetical protein|nr:AAA family ATPase [Gammaproteobacteria bacterium]MBT3489003.1 AAA family ATPase [Gammaproteobacteria bacterium]MBT3719191.1 AAA family ATPase [Gammaproteobacteria bacterium]MBT3845015.1 AAA family ATPase [Gammaproteobacteria bacterium]MBT3894314.1 AAA family ATPase [Gammaproteobacteria bacterium]
MKRGFHCNDQEQQSQLIANLIPLLEKQYTASVTTIETHISTILLVEEQAFKIKKPVNFGFLDFSTLEQRHHYCQEELRLNGRTAPAIYQQLVAIKGSIEVPQISGEGVAIEYMVQMARFEQDQILQRLLSTPHFGVEVIDKLASSIVAFHQSIPAADGSEAYVQPKIIEEAVQQNFDQIRPHLEKVPLEAQRKLASLESWSEQQYRHLKPLLFSRVEQGFVRECHGDMHLGNIALIDGQITLFDGIEFNEAFRWIDVMSDLSFLLMDLQRHGEVGCATRLLNQYLEVSGDYSGVQLLPFYQIYRAMVRIKVGLFRLVQLPEEDAEYEVLQGEIAESVELADCLMNQHCGALMITHGVSGSGKSYVSQQVLESMNAIRIRSDVERIRMFPEKKGRYSSAATLQTYQKIHHLAHSVAEGGYTVLLDATYLKQAQREQAVECADEIGCNFLILDMQCSREELERRIRHRIELSNDPSEADIEVLHQQLQQQEPLVNEEITHALVVTPEVDLKALLKGVASLQRCAE